MKKQIADKASALDIRKIPLSKIIAWEKNPRGIEPAEAERLKSQIERLGIYKPLVCCYENGKYVTLGGNMRLSALRELEYKEIEVSVVKAKTDAEKLEYALSDNDRAGHYIHALVSDLALLIEEHARPLFKLDLGEASPLDSILAGIEKAAPEETEIEEELQAGTECPKCGYRW